MAGASQPFSIEIHDAELRRRLSALTRAAGTPTQALREIGEILYASTRARFATETGPDGQRWEENADSTLLNFLHRRGGLSRRRTATGGRTLTARGTRAIAAKKVLTDRGGLQDSIAYQLVDGGRAVAVGTSKVYGAMQQLGGTRAQWPHLWGDIPARPFLGISAADRAGILDVLHDHLDAAI